MIKHRKIRKTKFYIAVTLAVLIVLSTLQINQIILGSADAATESNQWAINLQTKGEGNNSDNFRPFEIVQITANVTYGNTIASNTLVTFRMSLSGTNPVNVTRILSTDADGLATFAFRIPVDSQTHASQTWNVSATIQTPDGPVEQSISFTSQWIMEITNIKLLDLDDNEQTAFNSSDVIKVELSVDNREEAQSGNVSISILDSTGTTINQTIAQNRHIDQNSSKLQASIQVPSNATAGTATIEATLFSGCFEGLDIPATESKTATFTITTGGGTQPTLSPTPTPSPTPPPFEMTISLFSWLLVATGGFTFSALYLFLRRKPNSKLGTSMPNLPPTGPNPTFSAAASTLIPSALAHQEDANGKQTAVTANQSNQVLTQLSKVSASNQRIKELKAALNLEKQQLDNNLTELTKTIDEQEIAVKNYFNNLRQEIKKSKEALSDEPKKEPEDNN